MTIRDGPGSPISGWPKETKPKKQISMLAAPMPPCEQCSLTNYTCDPRHQWEAWTTVSHKSPAHEALNKAAFKARGLYIELGHLSERLNSADTENADSKTWDEIWAKNKTTRARYSAAIEEWHAELNAYKITCVTEKWQRSEPVMAICTRFEHAVGTHETTRLRDTPVTALDNDAALDDAELVRLDGLADVLDQAWGPLE